jgi:preprotein translocase subunit YajC
MTSQMATVVPTAYRWLVPQAQSAGTLVQFASLLVIAIIFYFLLIRPAQTRQKKTQQMLSALKNGDKVVTNGGIYGTIVGLDDETLQLRIADNVKIKVARSAVAGVQPGEEKTGE